MYVRVIICRFTPCHDIWQYLSFIVPASRLFIRMDIGRLMEITGLKMSVQYEATRGISAIAVQLLSSKHWAWDASDHVQTADQLPLT